jgi:hypothetical protein
MITGPESAKHIERLSGMDFYPHSDKPALRELRVAGESAHSSLVLAKVIDNWLESETRCPKPAELRRLIHESHSRFVQSKCEICSNSGWVTVWKLITYYPGTFNIKHCETLPQDFEASVNLRAKLGKDQDVLSAAKPCICLPADHKYLTGERQ